ncbi:MAG: hypothetical protein KA157_08840 [Aliarcobacter sp.]|nr:hypothetical protein [Aliarcobacter sp.]
MPQLIAMVIVVVGAMIYMFQTFGGTGDKIEGIAQKTSLMTELNNLKNGLQIAIRTGDLNNAIADDAATTAINESRAATTLKTLATNEYFADQINKELTSTNYDTSDNVYYAISFGGKTDKSMAIRLIMPTQAQVTAATGAATAPVVRPGLYVDLTQGNLKNNAAFLESQLVNDLSATASIDRIATSNSDAVTLDSNGNVPTTAPTTEQLNDGKLVIYFKDFEQNAIK